MSIPFYYKGRLRGSEKPPRGKGRFGDMEKKSYRISWNAKDGIPLDLGALGCRAAKTARSLLDAGCEKAEAVRREVGEEVRAFRERDPAAESDLEVLLLYSGVHAVLAHRVAHALHTRGYTLSARAISQLAKTLTGIEIHPGAKIGHGLVIDHGSGVVIGETAEIGDNCTLYQGVTLGGTGKDTGKRHPTLGNNVMVGAGAKVLGPFSVGDNVKIAANAVVLDAIPSDSTAVGIPARVVRRGNEKVCSGGDLDQIHIPDPVAQEICRLERRIFELEKQLAAEKTNGKTTESKSEDQ